MPSAKRSRTVLFRQPTMAGKAVLFRLSRCQTIQGVKCSSAGRGARGGCRNWWFFCVVAAHARGSKGRCDDGDVRQFVGLVILFSEPLTFCRPHGVIFCWSYGNGIVEVVGVDVLRVVKKKVLKRMLASQE